MPRITIKELLPWILGVVVILLGVAVGKQALRRYQLYREQEGLRSTVQGLQAKNHELLSLLEYVKSPVYAEEQARLRLGLAKPGEQLAVITDGSVAVHNEESALPPTKAVPEPEDSNAKKWWGYFFVP